MLNIYDLHKKRFKRDAQRNAYYKKFYINVIKGY